MRYCQLLKVLNSREIKLFVIVYNNKKIIYLFLYHVVEFESFSLNSMKMLNPQLIGVLNFGEMKLFVN